MALLSETRTANDNVSSYDDLTRRIGTIESTVIAWMGQATALHSAVDTVDQASILALRTDLIARLNTATTI